MKSELTQILVDPKDGSSLTLAPDRIEGSDIVSGALRSSRGPIYTIVGGIPRFVDIADEDQAQTSRAFAYKWGKRNTYDSPAAKQTLRRWLVEKYGFDSAEAWNSYYNGRSQILDLGCGSGLSSSLWLESESWQGSAAWVGADISEAIDVASDRLSHIPNTHFVQADALSLPFHDGAFDTVFSEGVLHHTPSTQTALQSGARVLAEGGHFHFYVYRKKGPVREFTDDYVRDAISGESEEGAWNAVRSLTRLGQALSEIDVNIELKEPIPLLGILAGRHDIQRLVYWNFAKLYWNEALSFEENVHVNYDWYRPHYAHRQTAGEVKLWCEESNLQIDWFHEQESGYTVRATKKG